MRARVRDYCCGVCGFVFRFKEQASGGEIAGAVRERGCVSLLVGVCCWQTCVIFDFQSFAGAVLRKVAVPVFPELGIVEDVCALVFNCCGQRMKAGGCFCAGSISMRRTPVSESWDT